MLNFVIARFKEDVEWLNQLPPDSRINLYNKGPALDPTMFRNGNVRVIPLRNAGRESQTYIHHLMHEFRAEEGAYTVFTQGDPFEHAPYFLDLVADTARWRHVQPLSLQWMAEKNIPPRLVVESDRRDWMGGLPVRPEHFSLQTWAPLHFFDEGAWGIGATYRQKHMLSAGENIMAHFLELCGLNELAATAREGDLGVFSYGAIFAAHNTRIANFLAQAGRHLEKIELLTRADMNYGYIFERVWMHLFGEPFRRLPALDGAVWQVAHDAGPAGATDGPVRERRANPAAASVAQLRQKAFDAHAQGDILLATDLLERALAVDPTNHNLVCDMATLALSQNDIKSAEALAEVALKLRPDHGSSHYVLAHARIRAGRTSEALPLLRALSTGPAHDSLIAEAPELVNEVRRDLSHFERLETAAA
jgi:tetratricopeptide (TPR) repeat protein